MEVGNRSSVTESDPSRLEGIADPSTSTAIAEKAELRKNLNAYAIMAYVAVADRNAMAEQLKGLDHVSKAMGELKERLQREEEQKQNLQLEIWRNEAFVTRSRLQLKIRDNQIQSLTEQLDKLKRAEEGTKEEGGESRETDHMDSGKGSGETEDGKSLSEDKKGGEQSEADEKEKPKTGDYLMKGGVQIGVSREIHEAVVQENLQLKKTIQLIENHGASLKDLVDTIQYKEVIKQLKRKVADKEEELAEVQATVKQAEGPKEQTAKNLLEMKAQVKDYERTIKLKQVMCEALSSRCEELSQALKSSNGQDDYKLAYVKSAFADSSNPKAKKDMADEVLPSLEIKKLTKENATMKRLQQVQEKENATLRREVDKLTNDKKDVERKLAAARAAPYQPCVTCTDYEQELTTVRNELTTVRNEFKAALIQGETYKSDYQEKCETVEKLKSAHQGELETWKTNFQRLNRQTEHFRRELEDQMKINQQLQAQIRLYSQEIQQYSSSNFRNTYSPAASLPQPQRCSPMFNPWQETGRASMPSEVVVGRDQSDSPHQDLDGSSVNQSVAARQTRQTRRTRKLKCIHCHMEFSPERQRQYEDHQRTCNNT